MVNCLRGGEVKEVLSLLIFLLMLFVCGMRGIDVGRDTSHYISYYVNGFSDRMEPMNTFLVGLCKWLGFSPRGYLMTCAVLTYAPIYLFLRKVSCNTAFSLLIFLAFSVYFYHQTFNIVRAYMAIAYMLFAYYFLSQKRYLLMFLFLIIGVMCHYSALFTIPFLLFAWKVKRVDFKYVFPTIIVSALFGFSSSENFQNMADQIGLFLESYNNTAVFTYMSNLQEVRQNEWTTIGILLHIIPFSLFVLLMHNKRLSESIYYKLFFLAVVISNCLSNVFLGYRITQFFFILLIVLLPRAVRLSKGIKMYSLISLSGIMILFYVYQLLAAKPHISLAGTIPYSF